MASNIDWSDWILQKNNEAKAEELKKSNHVEIEDLEKGAKKIDKGHSVFTMDHVNHVASLKNHDEAKSFAHDVVDKSTANPQNKIKIKSVIDKSKSVAQLASSMSNHILAHPGEDLAVIKSEAKDLEKADKAKPKTETIEEFKARGGTVNKLPNSEKPGKHFDSPESEEGSFKDAEHGEGGKDWDGRDFIADTQNVRAILKNELKPRIDNNGDDGFDSKNNKKDKLKPKIPASHFTTDVPKNKISHILENPEPKLDQLHPHLDKLKPRDVPKNKISHILENPEPKLDQFHRHLDKLKK